MALDQVVTSDSGRTLDFGFRSPEARADLRAIDRETALQHLHCVDRYVLHLEGDVKELKPPRTDFRLRWGDYRLSFDPHGKDTIRITRVLNRREAYRFQN
jgi:mRNA-degrading endonuclease RelE of RelBE toxin-antitoxin system